MSYYRVVGANGRTSPPVDERTLYGYVRDGTIKPGTLIIDETANTTVPAAQHPRLIPIFRQQGVPTEPPRVVQPRVVPPTPQAAQPAPVYVQPETGSALPQDGGMYPFRKVGQAMLLGGLAFAAYMLFVFDTSIPVDYRGYNSADLPARVHNLGLMQQQTGGIVLGVGVSIVGVILMVHRRR